MVRFGYLIRPCWQGAVGGSLGAKWGLKISPQGSGCECSTTQALWGETGAVFVSGIPKSPTLLLISGVVDTDGMVRWPWGLRILFDAYNTILYEECPHGGPVKVARLGFRLAGVVSIVRGGGGAL